MKHITRGLALALALIIVALPARAATFRAQVTGILSDWEANDKACDTVDRQKANGAYCAARLLSVICSEVDDGAWTDTIRGIDEMFVSDDQAANTALKAQVNGLYRCVEYMYVFTSALDVSGAWRQSIATVWNNYEAGDAAARSSKGMAAQALDCVAEFAYIAACICDAPGAYAVNIDEYWDAYQSAVGKGSLNAQMVNASAAAAEFMYIADRSLDTNNRYRARTNEIMDRFDALRAASANQDQQIVNGLYRLVELLGVMGHQLAAGR